MLKRNNKSNMSKTQVTGPQSGEAGRSGQGRSPLSWGSRGDEGRHKLACRFRAAKSRVGSHHLQGKEAGPVLRAGGGMGSEA